MSARKKTRLEQRAAQSQKIAKQADVAFETLCRMPSFTGKAKFMDQLRRVKDNAHQLTADLTVDVSEDRQAVDG